MKHVANSRFAIKSWDEKPYSEGPDLPKLTRAVVTRTFTGDISVMGMSRNEYSATARPRSSASSGSSGRSQGKREVRAPPHGSIRERRGEGVLFVIPGSGTGDLAGLRGEGTSAVGHGTEHPLALNYEFG